MDAEAGSRSLSFEGLKLPFRECGGATRRKGHRYRSVCFCRVFTPESGALVAVLSDLFHDGYGRRDTVCPYMTIMLKYQAVCSAVLKASRKRFSCAGQCCSSVNPRPLVWDAM